MRNTDLELIYNVLYQRTEGAEGVSTLPKEKMQHHNRFDNLPNTALRNLIKKNVEGGFTPAPFLKPSDGIGINI